MEEKQFYSQEEIINKTFGVKGTPKRDKFESDLDLYLVGRKIQEIRKSKGLTQEELGDLMGLQRALLLLVLISYIQPFNDGNKRTARIVSNAELIANDYCPISFRTIDSVEYKMAMLLFYEQNNISVFKKIFIDQFEFAVTTYF